MGSERALRTGGLLAALLLGACGAGHEYKKPLHVVLIVVDTLRADHLSTYAYRRPTSPELDKLAAQGAVFERAISQCSWTLPSMVSMMTGTYLADEVTKIPADKTTLASVFQKAGFATAAFINNDVLNPENGFQAGFDVFDYQDPPYRPIDKINDWIVANRGKRTFTFIHLNEAHDPYGQAKEFNRFANEKDALTNPRLDWYREITRQSRLSNSDDCVRRINAEIGGYDDDVRYSDDHIGKILAAIRAGGEWDQTAIVVAADHGEGLWTRVDYMTGPRLKAKLQGEPATLLNTLQVTHGNHVNIELVHVPLILVAPGMPQGVRVHPCVENVDISATLLELCDLPRPTGLQGSSLLPLWSQPEVVAHQKRGSFTHTRYVSSFIDQNGYQLIKPTPRGECEFGLEVELYDLNKDPEERVNLASSEPARRDGLAREIEARMKLGLVASSVTLPGSEEQRARMNELGYVDAGTVDSIDKENAAKSIEQLFTELATPQIANCLVRIRLAIALLPRDLSAEQKSTLRGLRDREESSAIRTILDEVLKK